MTAVMGAGVFTEQTDWEAIRSMTFSFLKSPSSERLVLASIPKFWLQVLALTPVDSASGVPKRGEVRGFSLPNLGLLFAMGYEGWSDSRSSQHRCGRRSVVSERIPARTDRLPGDSHNRESREGGELVRMIVNLWWWG